jgi:hypothetical protein
MMAVAVAAVASPEVAAAAYFDQKQSEVQEQEQDPAFVPIYCSPPPTATTISSSFDIPLLFTGQPPVNRGTWDYVVLNPPSEASPFADAASKCEGCAADWEGLWQGDVVSKWDDCGADCTSTCMGCGFDCYRDAEEDLDADLDIDDVLEELNERRRRRQRGFRDRLDVC